MLKHLEGNNSIKITLNYLEKMNYNIKIILNFYENLNDQIFKGHTYFIEENLLIKIKKIFKFIINL